MFYIVVIGFMNVLNLIVGLNVLKSEGGKYFFIVVGDFNYFKNQFEVGSQMLSELQLKN